MIGGTLWQSVDGYSATAGERTVALKLEGEGPFTFEVRNRAEKHSASTGYTLRFKQLVVADVSYDVQTLRLHLRRAVAAADGQHLRRPERWGDATARLHLCLRPCRQPHQ